MVQFEHPPSTMPADERPGRPPQRALHERRPSWAQTLRVGCFLAMQNCMLRCRHSQKDKRLVSGVLLKHACHAPRPALRLAY